MNPVLSDGNGRVLVALAVGAGVAGLSRVPRCRSAGVCRRQMTVLDYAAHDQMDCIVSDEKRAVLVVLVTWADFAGLLRHYDATMRYLPSLKPLFWCVPNPIDRFPVWRGKRSYNVVLVEESPPFVLLEASGITASSAPIATRIVSECNAEVRAVVPRKVPESDQGRRGC